MVFKYFEFPLLKPSPVLGASILRPIIPIKISANNLLVKYDALIDSGADFCIFHAEIGEYLGLDVKSGLREIFGGVEDSIGAEAYSFKRKTTDDNPWMKFVGEAVRA